ncbi:hypothetical protein BDW60DRAFT_175162 [Aspergillus nidulans var. acristatus]
MSANAVCTMLLPQQDCQSRPSEVDGLLDEEVSQLRQHHSLPRSLTHSEVKEPSSAPGIDALTPRGDSRHSKTVRFALGSKSIQYFNPTERPSLVQKCKPARYMGTGFVR